MPCCSQQTAAPLTSTCCCWSEGGFFNINFDHFFDCFDLPDWSFLQESLAIRALWLTLLLLRNICERSIKFCSTVWRVKYTVNQYGLIKHDCYWMLQNFSHYIFLVNLTHTASYSSCFICQQANFICVFDTSWQKRSKNTQWRSQNNLQDRNMRRRVALRNRTGARLWLSPPPVLTYIHFLLLTSLLKDGSFCPRTQKYSFTHVRYYFIWEGFWIYTLLPVFHEKTINKKQLMADYLIF